MDLSNSIKKQAETFGFKYLEDFHYQPSALGVEKEGKCHICVTAVLPPGFYSKPQIK